MCGIVGTANFSAPRLRPAEEIRAMNAVLAHRGPDASAIHVAFGAQVAVGHTLLSIVGSGTNAQPLRKQVFVKSQPEREEA